MTQPIEESHAGRVIGRRVVRFNSLPSTNSLALSWAKDPSLHGTVILAAEQSAGRGRHGRRWLAPPGQCVLLSTIVFPPADCRRPPLLTAWAAVSACEVAERLTGQPAALKWPNDVLMTGRKVAGVLIEQRGAATVAGIGLNVNQGAELHSAGLSGATSLALAAGYSFDVAAAAESLIDQLDHWYDSISRSGAGALEDEWRKRLALEGRQVSVEASGQELSGTLTALRFAGITLAPHSGGLHTFAPESVSRLTPLAAT